MLAQPQRDARVRHALVADARRAAAREQRELLVLGHARRAEPGAAALVRGGPARNGEEREAEENHALHCVLSDVDVDILIATNYQLNIIIKYPCRLL